MIMVANTVIKVGIPFYFTRHLYCLLNHKTIKTAK